MNLKESINLLNSQGYCLWVGAGVSSYLSTGTHINIPTWETLVGELEKMANIKSPSIPATLPERFELILSHLSTYTFRQKIRELVLKKVSEAVVAHAEINGDNVPEPIIRIAKLGFLANPIINFNVEILTSRILAAGGGHYSIKTYGKREYDEKGTIESGSGFSKRNNKYEDQRFKRHIYHPHGNINGYGISVFTDEDYKRQTDSLAFQLATHSAFDDTLVIVGMSLDDKYLREQIGKFRKEIHNVFWFQTSKVLESEVTKWCWRYDIQLITFNKWSDFWDQVDSILPSPPEIDLLVSWLHLVSESIGIINDSSEIENQIKMWQSPGTPDDFILRQKMGYAKRGISFSESLDSKPIISKVKSAKLQKNILKRIAKLK